MRRTLAPLLAAALALIIGVTAVAGAQVTRRTWRASLGTDGVHGREVLSGYADGTGRIDFQLIGMLADTNYAAQVYQGTCSRPGAVVVRWLNFKTDGAGATSGARPISQVIMNRIWYYNRSGPTFIRFVAGSSIACGDLGYDHATRVSIPAYSIDLPVVPGPDGYPYCNVAMYLRILSQPTEPGVTFIYAHARTGMFLPLLNASKVNNGAAMIGRLVYVYTSSSMMDTYRIVRVRRHVTSVQNSIGVIGEHLWLQTSEGPNYSYPKLVIVADRIASTPVSYAASHPTPHIVHCG
jgi:hypothetical protein